MASAWRGGTPIIQGFVLGLAVLTCLHGALSSEMPGGVAKAPATRARIQNALEILEHVSVGKGLLGRTRSRWGLRTRAELLEIFEWGEVSKTDAVLTRYYNPATGQESRERRITIYLRKDQTLEELVLDIAHELTHAIARPSWDPYDPELTPGKYIWTALEGEGGEVEALATECEVGYQLTTRYGLSNARCQKYRATSGVEREKIRRDFYRVGKWKSGLTEQLGSEITRFPLLSADAPQLYSSTGQAPYPVALLGEFQEITEIACENSKKRLAHIEPSRAPASGPSPRESVARFISKRCR